MEDITRDELKEWINKNAMSIASLFNNHYGIGYHPFLYPKQSGKDLLIMKYNRDAEDKVIGVVKLPPRAMKYASAKSLLAAKVKAVRDWWAPQFRSGRHFMQKQTESYPKTPQEKNTLFYVLRQSSTGNLLTYPGSLALRTFTVLPEAQAAAQLAARENGSHYGVVCVVEKPTHLYDELTLEDNLTAIEGWYYQAPQAVAQITKQ